MKFKKKIIIKSDFLYENFLIVKLKKLHIKLDWHGNSTNSLILLKKSTRLFNKFSDLYTG
jgi:hypothetical protein